MIRFKKNGTVVMTESDNGDMIVEDKKLAEAFKADGITIRESKEEDQEKEGKE